MSKKIGFVKPNFTQMQSNYVVADPKDTVEMLQKSGYRIEVITKENCKSKNNLTVVGVSGSGVR